MKQIEVIAHFYNKKIKVVMAAFGKPKDVIKPEKIKILDSKDFENKELKYFKLTEKTKNIIVAYKPETLEWFFVN